MSVGRLASRAACRSPLGLVGSAHMSSRLSIVAGLLVGIAVAALVLGGIVAFAPDPVPTAQPTPSLPAVRRPPASARPAASSSTSGRSPSASGSASSASPSTACRPPAPRRPAARRRSSAGAAAQGAAAGGRPRLDRAGIGRVRVGAGLSSVTPGSTSRLDARRGPDARRHRADAADRPARHATPAPVGASRPGSSGWARAVASGLAARPGRLLVVADFDGTLAEASRDPGAARIVPLAQRALRRLAGVAAAHPERVSVAVLTGQDRGRRRGPGRRRRDRLSRRPRPPARDVPARRPPGEHRHHVP